jgi:glyoxylase-like metal-dependent hydrolase (beta-lactamase superfamily II)
MTAKGGSSHGAVAVAEDVWHFRMPLVGHSIGHVNVYALRAEGRILLIDCGWRLPGCLERLEAMLAQVGAELADVSQVLLTHVHADHAGLAGELRRRTGASIGMHAADARQVHCRYIEQTEYKAETEAWATAVGAPQDARDVARAQLVDFKERFAPVEADLLIDSGSVIEHGRFRLTVTHTPGHTPGHLCFFESTKQLLFTGDTVMPRINYGATHRPLGCADPLSAWEASLRLLLDQPARLALPGHQEIFSDPDVRIHRLLQHHERRSSELLNLLAGSPATAWELSARVPRRRVWGDLPVPARLSAVGETMAHLVRLANTGAVDHESETRRWRCAENRLPADSASTA